MVQVQVQADHERWRGSVDAKLDGIGRDTSEQKSAMTRLGDKLDELIGELRKENKDAEQRMVDRIKPLEDWRANMMGRLVVICSAVSLIGGGIVTFLAHSALRSLVP